jgi:hypothetical protein
VTESEARREKGERNRKQRQNRREEKQKRKGEIREIEQRRENREVGDFLRKEGSKRERSRNKGGFSGSQQLLLSLHRLEQRHRQPLTTFLSLL